MADHPLLYGSLLLLATGSVIHGYVRTTTRWEPKIPHHGGRHPNRSWSDGGAAASRQYSGVPAAVHRRPGGSTPASRRALLVGSAGIASEESNVGIPEAQDTAERLRTICGELSDRFYERADVVRMLVVTLLAGQHSLLLGPPGTAKSEMARELTGRIAGATYWEILLSKFTAPTRMFGPIDVAALARGEYRQIYDGRATTAHVAFIDEIFKCSTAALNETLGYLNERIYHPENGGEPIHCP